MAKEAAGRWGELALYSLVKNPFLLPSLALHLLLFYLLGTAALSVNPDESSIPIKLIELGTGKSLDKSIGPDHGPGGPRALPKLGFPEIPRQRSGRLDAGSLETTTPGKEPASAPENVPPLPQPKRIADVGRLQPFTVKETSPGSLIQLPTKDTASNFAPAVNPDSNQKSLAALKGKGDGEGIRALSEGTQIPGALKATGTGTGPYGLPEGIREGKGASGGGTGIGSGGGSLSGLSSNPDFAPYFKMIESRVRSVWQYPEGISGRHEIYLSFALDRAGKLIRVEVMDSKDSRLSKSAVEAMKRASPFPPIPESLKSLAGEELGFRFTVDNEVKGAQ